MKYRTGTGCLEQPVISYDLPLTKIHHVAFDAHLIGILPQFPSSCI